MIPATAVSGSGITFFGDAAPERPHMVGGDAMYSASQPSA